MADFWTTTHNIFGSQPFTVQETTSHPRNFQGGYIARQNEYQQPSYAFNVGDQFVPHGHATHQRIRQWFSASDQQPLHGWPPPPPPRRRPTCWDPPTTWETSGQRTFLECSSLYQQPPLYPPYTGEPTVYLGYEPYRQQHVPLPHDPYLAYGESTSDPYRLQHSNGQPWQQDRPFLPCSSSWCPPSHHRSEVLPVAPPPSPQSGSMNLPQQPRKFIDSDQQHGLPNNPDLMVRSLSPAQLAAINDYNKKLHVYRLKQAALIAHVTAMFDENIENDNLAKEHTDNTPMMVFGEDVPNDVTDVSNNAAPTDGATLDLPNEEALEEIVKNDNESPQVLIKPMDEKNYECGFSFLEVYVDKIVIFIDPIHRELEIKDDVEYEFYVENLTEYVSCYEDITRILIKSLSTRKIGAANLNSKSSRSLIMSICIFVSWCRGTTQSLIHD